MRWQQNLAELVIKGDETLDTIFPPKDEQPEWATFDEDLDESAPVTQLDDERDRRSEGRFALYSTDAPEPEAPTGKPAARKPAAERPEVVVELDYDELTLAQLRARLQSLSLDELDALLSYEEATKNRAPFQTLLANRITRASAK
jgi:hypothetical protein